MLTTTTQPVKEAWGMIERAEPGDSVSVGVALDYVMDALGCERDIAKWELYVHVSRVITESAKDYSDQSLSTSLSLYLHGGEIQNAKLFMSGYTSVMHDEFGGMAKRLVKLCSWVESVE